MYNDYKRIKPPVEGEGTRHAAVWVIVLTIIIAVVAGASLRFNPPSPMDRITIKVNYDN